MNQNKPKHITLGHGAGGKLTLELIDSVFHTYFNNEFLQKKNDSSVFEIPGSIAMTTDSYVIDPIFFPGGNIGKLAVCGTANDLLVSGAEPVYMSAGFIIEEGFLTEDLIEIVKSMAEEANKNKIKIITGDTKVVRKGQCDKIFINTTGIGKVLESGTHLSESPQFIEGDKIIVSGNLGDHAMAILATRNNIKFEEELISDVASLNEMILPLLLKNGQSVRFMRDITRGGLAMIVNELCQGKSFGMELNEQDIPVRKEVAGLCEVFGFDPLHLANEGKAMFIVAAEKAEEILQDMKETNIGKNARIVGVVTFRNPGKVLLNSLIGGSRIVDMPSGEIIPRIC
jgi:hydrogenase expression/formation protein HypE